MTDYSALKLDCRWYRFQEAPPGSYAVLYSPDGKLKGATLSWLPRDRNASLKGYVLPIPEIEAAVAAMNDDGPRGYTHFRNEGTLEDLPRERLVEISRNLIWESETRRQMLQTIKAMIP